MNCSF